MHKNHTRAVAAPRPVAGPAAPDARLAVAAPEPETRDLTRDELRRLVLDIIG